jgi:chromate transporter
MIAYIRRETVEKRHWLDAGSFGDGVSLCQIIPGATAMQTAAYVGLRVRGPLGALAAFAGFGLPSFLLMLPLAAVYARSRDLPGVVGALNGLRAVTVAMMINAATIFGRDLLGDWRALAIALGTASLFVLGVSPAMAIVFAAIIGFVLLRPVSSQPHRPSAARRVSVSPWWLAGLLFAGIAVLASLFLFQRGLFEISLTMLKIDLLSFGGAFAAVPLMFHEFVSVRGWITSRTLMDAMIIGQVAPGPIIKTATFVGYLFQGFAGGLVAAISVFLPSFFLLLALAPHFDRLRASPQVQRLTGGVFCSFVGLLLAVAIRFSIEIEWDLRLVLLAVAALLALLRRIEVFWVVAAGAIASALLFA